MNGRAIADLPPDTVVGDRFHVLSGHLWIDTQSQMPLDREMTLPAIATPYLKLYPHRRHIPEVYGVYTPGDDHAPIVLLNNLPIDSDGRWLPTIAAVWKKAAPTRQLSWLWQLGELWMALEMYGVAGSVLNPNNIYVDGWRIRLRELIDDETQPSGEASLSALGALWMTWAGMAHSSIQKTIYTIGEDLQKPNAHWQMVSPKLNAALVHQAALSSLTLDIAGATTAGHGRSLNEDACYPITLSVNGSVIDVADDLQPRVAIVCDGICGHAGGEVASQLVVRALKLQLRALFSDLVAEPIPLSPDIIMRQIETAIRVVNNLVAFQNNEQSRQARQRMGTTLVMAVQVPQHVATPAGSANTHEVYIAHVGDSRAYWLTPDGCHCLTVDDDVMAREVIEGRSLPREAARRTDAIALTQALGTRSGDYLHIRLQRFMIDEDGVLLLCSDGLSDGGLVERYWKSMANNVLRGRLELNRAAEIWLKLADQHNGHDNASVVLMCCRTSTTASDGNDASGASPSFSHSPSINIAHASRSEVSGSGPKEFGANEFGARGLASDSATPGRLSSPAHEPLHEFLSDASENQENRDFGQFQFNAHEIDPMDSISADPAFQSIGDAEEFEQLARTLLENSAPSETESDDDDEAASGWGTLAFAIFLSIVMFIVGAGGVFAWRRYAPTNFNDTLEQTMDTLSRYLKFIQPVESDQP
jgi:protein phosphatase